MARYQDIIKQTADVQRASSSKKLKETKRMNENTKVLTNETFMSEIANGVTLVDFYADWCMPCKMLSPTIAAIANDFEGKIKVGKLNIDDAQSIAAKYGVMSIPTVILFKDGAVVEKKVGLSTKEVYESMIHAAVGN
jgi:thioredoxin 1